MLKKLPYYAKLSIRTSLPCCASTGIALAKVTSCSFGYSSNKLSAISGNIRKLQIVQYDKPCVLKYCSNNKEASWIFRFIVLKWIEKRVFDILCQVSFKDRTVLMMSLINHTSILREAKVVCKIALTIIVQNAVGGWLKKK